MSQKLLTKIKNKEAVVGVIGLGYVGLPLAVEKAKAGYKTIGFDIEVDKVKKVNQGENYIGDIVADELEEVTQSNKLEATTDFSKLSEVDCVAICVPTPLDNNFQPDVSMIERVTESIAKNHNEKMLIVLESTSYPGTTKEVIKPILEDEDLEVGEDFYLAFSPERVDPGNGRWHLKNTPKVVGGVTEKGTEIVAELYENIIEEEVYKVSSPEIAEMEKILENTYRNINIALANEMAIICDKMDIDVWEVIEAAKTKPYGFKAFYPGPGVGGHCIPIDPFYLNWKTREYDYHTRLIELAGEINNSMPEFTVKRVMEILNRFGKPLNGAKILQLGVAFKQDVDDLRHSPALEVLENLEQHGADLKYNDPFVPQFEFKDKEYKSAPLTTQNLEEADLVIITTKHQCYDYDFIQKHSDFIFDTKNAMKDVDDRGNIEKL